MSRLGHSHHSLHPAHPEYLLLCLITTDNWRTDSLCPGSCALEDKGEKTLTWPFIFSWTFWWTVFIASVYKSSHRKVCGISSVPLFWLTPTQAWRGQFQTHLLQGMFPDGSFHFLNSFGITICTKWCRRLTGLYVSFSSWNFPRVLCSLRHLFTDVCLSVSC